MEYKKEVSKEKRGEGDWRSARRGEAVYREMCKEMYKEVCKEGVLKKKQARAVVQWIIGRWIRLD